MVGIFAIAVFVVHIIIVGHIFLVIFFAFFIFFVEQFGRGVSYAAENVGVAQVAAGFAAIKVGVESVGRTQGRPGADFYQMPVSIAAFGVVGSSHANPVGMAVAFGHCRSSGADYHVLVFIGDIGMG
jgi:hypothetical protein